MHHSLNSTHWWGRRKGCLRRGRGPLHNSSAKSTAASKFTTMWTSTRRLASRRGEIRSTLLKARTAIRIGCGKLFGVLCWYQRWRVGVRRGHWAVRGFVAVFRSASMHSRRTRVCL
ncbi:uncharacterized protein MYCGRDRAFT_105090 [Zymoseptoria tritici IPO323]|uniref:Uncharacterized protein n=1 Tax=Zymoseptoria tritici (strain CBS 115943 / IPO323) TaxID=336722 RepID=F9XF29_ZYMTI|nr:uncharacterized protein MYCGRDRAFT_105090 [Zymoseptoria tritici IPO323]EGP85611.1 hypothetical protein MYCGRDRAFT_105090 [Zymoseptoria tritici IPO323]